MGLRRTMAGPSKKKKSSALGESLVVVAGPCEFFWGNVIYQGAGTPWLQLHDLAAVPSSGTGVIPLASAAVATPVAGSPGTGQGYIECVTGLPMANGAVLVLSSTQDTYTALGANEGILLGTFH